VGGNKWRLYGNGSLLLDEEMRNFDEDKRQKNPDEIVVENIKMFHLENMSPEHLWMSVNCEDGRLYHLNISAKGGKLTYYWSEETP
jgi:hypothetical protein